VRRASVFGEDLEYDESDPDGYRCGCARVADWWDERVPEQLRKEAEKRQKKELDSAVTPRSDEAIDYLTFGELVTVIVGNWDVFGAVFSSAKAVERVRSNLNTLRGPIAHCSPLAEDEVVRLRLAVRDWFRLEE
jgi:hypothetical protein